MIRPADAAVWLADSVNKAVTTHRTSELAVGAILEYGVQIERAELDGGWGQGFYSATRPDPRYGVASVRVAVRLARPLVVDDTIEGKRLIDELLAEADSEDVRAVLIARGYDGVMIHWGPDDTWIVAFRDDQIKVLQGR